VQKRLTELETRSAFQEETLEQSSRIIAHQQQVIDKLQREINLLARRMAELQPSPAAGTAQEPPPPHY